MELKLRIKTPTRKMRELFSEMSRRDDQEREQRGRERERERERKESEGSNERCRSLFQSRIYARRLRRAVYTAKVERGSIASFRHCSTSWLSRWLIKALSSRSEWVHRAGNVRQRASGPPCSPSATSAFSAARNAPGANVKEEKCRTLLEVGRVDKEKQARPPGRFSDIAFIRAVLSAEQRVSYSDGQLGAIRREH
jgi:hypothetical protein